MRFLLTLAISREMDFEKKNCWIDFGNFSQKIDKICQIFEFQAESGGNFLLSKALKKIYINF